MTRAACGLPVPASPNFCRNCSSSCSSVRPRVSGTMLHINRMERTPIAANRKNVDEIPIPATREGKNRPTKKFVIHKRKTEPKPNLKSPR